jgi:hypothetical protein
MRHLQVPPVAGRKFFPRLSTGGIFPAVPIWQSEQAYPGIDETWKRLLYLK